MSTYSVIGLIALTVVVVIGTALKIILRIRRKKLDGLHGFVQKPEPGPNRTDDWELL